jgi:PAS domain S-box-containing protein
MRKILCLLLCLSGGMPASLWSRTLRIGVENNSEPLSFVDAQGRPVGFSAELLAAMAKAGPLDIEVVPGYWAQILDEFQRGRLDALANVTITEGRRATMDFSISHAYVHGLIYFRHGEPALTRTAQFAGKTIGTLAGSIGYTNALTHHGWGAKFIAYDSWQKALDATRAGEIDAALFIRSPSSGAEARNNGLDWAFVDDVVHQYHFAVHKGDGLALEQINEALATVRANGTFDRLYAKWIGPLEPHPIRLADLRPYYLPAGLVLLALLALFLWQRHMMARQARQAAQLRNSEERWKFALEGSGDGVWDWDAHTNQVHRSRRWKEMIGYADAEIGTGLDEWITRVHPDDLPAVIAMEDAHHRGETTSFAIEHRLRCKDGSWKWILNRGMIVSRDAGGRPLRMIGTHTDLTARKQAEEDRLVLGKLESTGVLAGGIAHDFNNLLTAILLNLDLARFHHESAASMLPRVEAAEKAALAARSLTQQLITFSKGDASVVQLADIGSLLHESMPLVLSGSAVRGDLQVADGLWPARVDAGQIGQVIRNLVLNAREAMPGGGVVTVTAENATLAAGEVTGLSAGDYVHIRVIDQGTGIPPAVMGRIFDPYFSTKQRGPQRGMGLGLTICHSVMQKHHGAITVESAPERGTTFHLYLPASHHQPPGKANSNPPLPSRADIARRILVMDDEPVMRETLVQALRTMGHEVTAAGDGQRAVELYRQAAKQGRPYAAVILDLTVAGGMGGHDALQAMRAVDPAVRAIVTSGYTNDKILHDHTAAGFKAALPKPFTSDMLQTVIKQVFTA